MAWKIVALFINRKTKIV